MPGMYDNVEGIVRRQMVLFFVIDTSGSMSGTKIGAVNTAIREVIPELKGIGGSDVDLKIAVLTFSNGCKWLYPVPIPVDTFQWNNLDADGMTDLGCALKELNTKMSKDAFLGAASGSVAPAIFLMSDGEATDDYDKGIEVIKKNNWYKYAIRVAIAIGDDAKISELEKFTGNREAVLTAHTPEVLKKMIRFVTITSSQIGSKSQPVQNDGQIVSKQENMIDQLNTFQQTDPAVASAASTSADDW
jgi:uncharacterized protein YegL